MDRTEIKSRLNEIFQDIFDDPSITHIDLIVEIEKKFKIKFSTGEVRGLKNVGDLIGMIAQKAV